MSTFEAGVQYNDFRGSVAADVSDNVALSTYLKQQGLIQSDDLIAGIRIASSGNTGADITSVSLVVYVYSSAEFDPAPANVRAIECQMSPGKALSFFKRFDLVMTRKGQNLHNTEVDGPHY